MDLNSFNKLNSMQLEAVKYTEGPLLILAGAGSGKTTVLINRISYIISQGLANPWQILAITFTNKAADELKNRLSVSIPEGYDDIWALTFHSACVRILRKHAETLGYDRYFNIYDTSDSVSLIKHILKDKNIDDKSFPPKAVLGEISRAKDKYIDPIKYEQMAKSSADLYKKKISEIYFEYQRRLKSSNSMDFDDLIYNVVFLFMNNNEIRNYWRNKFKYVLIDEYQDTNRLQYLFTSLIVNDYNNICVVGDDDQSIYKFRGASIENILSFESQYENCKVIRLEQNYRSTSHILDAANNVISNNRERKGKNLWTEAGAGDKIQLYVAETENEEAQYVSSTILDGIVRGQNYRDFAVLYRINAQSNNLEYAFKRNGIPYRIIGGTRFFDRSEIKDCIAYLNVIASQNDDLRLERIINIPPRGIGAKSVEKAIEIAKINGVSLFDIIKHADNYDELSRCAIKMREFSVLIEELQEFSANNTPEFLFEEFLLKSGYLQMYELKDDPESQSKAENIKELKTSIITYMNDTGDTSLEGYLSNVALYTDLDNFDSDSNSVVLMTMHASKGLEFPSVFVVGMEESIFPGLKAIGEDSEMEEERRLCYVAITRAMRHLFLVCAKRRMLFGHTQSNRVSRFVDEIDEGHISKYIPKGYAFSDKSFYETSSTYSNIQKHTIKPKFSNTVIQNDSIVPDFKIGDSVKHKAFGEGVIINVVPMGNDALIEINFSKVGNKKLMSKAAANFLTIL